MNGDIAHSEPEPPSLPRKITLERGTQGYGFNLHGEKGIHGQFISAIDDGSPAQKNDLRLGDRVIGVNNEDVENLAHAKVVERIRAAGSSVTLLVVDEQCDQYYKNLGMKIPQDRFEVPNASPLAPDAEENNAEEVETPEKNNERENVEDSSTVAEEREPIVQTPEIPQDISEEAIKENESPTTDADEYDEVIPKSTTETKPAEIPAEVPAEDIPSEPTAPEQVPIPTVTEEESTTTVSTTVVENSNGVETSETSFKLDMAAARPKPKRHDVKRATQNWKQKYDDFNKL